VTRKKKKRIQRKENNGNELISPLPTESLINLNGTKNLSTAGREQEIIDKRFFKPLIPVTQRNGTALEKRDRQIQKKNLDNPGTPTLHPPANKFQQPNLNAPRTTVSNKTTGAAKEEKEREAFEFMKTDVGEATANGKVQAKHEKGKPVVLVPNKPVSKEKATLKGKRPAAAKPLVSRDKAQTKPKNPRPAEEEKQRPEQDQQELEITGAENKKEAEKVNLLAPISPPRPEEIDKTLPAEVQQFLQNFFTLKAEAVSRRNSIAAKIPEQKVSISRKFEAEQASLSILKETKDAEISMQLKQSLAFVNGQFNARKKSINGDAKASAANADKANEKNVTDIKKAATDNLAQLKTDIDQRKKAFNDYVTEQKGQPEKIASKEADRADTELDKASAEAIKVGDQVALRFNDEDTAADQREASREVAKESAKDITDKKPGIREECMNKAKEFNGNYDEYTDDVMKQLDNAQTGLSDEIEKSKNKTLSDNETAHTKVIGDIEKGRAAIENALTASHNQITSSLQSTARAIKSKIQSEYEQGNERLQTIVQTINDSIDNEIITGIGAVDALIADNPDIAIAKLKTLDLNLANLGSASDESLSTVTRSTSDIFDKDTKSFQEQSDKLAKGFSSSSGKIQTQHRKSTDDLYQKFTTDSSSAVTNMIAGQAEMIKNAYTEIDKQIDERKGKIAKVNERFATDLKPAVDESIAEARKPLTDPLWSRCNEAGEKAGESWWEGVIDAIGSLIKGLLIIVALAALLVLIVAALGGTLGFMAAMLIVGVVMLSVAAVASFINRRNQGFGVAASLGLAVTDAFGLTGIWEAASGKEVGTGKHLSTYERSKRGTEGVLSVILIVAGVRGSKGGAAAEAAEAAEAGSKGGLFSGISKFLPEGLKTKFTSLGEAAEFFKGKAGLIEKGLQSVGGKLGKALGTDKAIPNLNESSFGKYMGDKFSWWPKTTGAKPAEVKAPLQEVAPAEKPAPIDEAKPAEQPKTAESKPEAEGKKPEPAEKPDVGENKPGADEGKAEPQEKPGVDEKPPELEEKPGADEAKPDVEDKAPEPQEKAGTDEKTGAEEKPEGPEKSEAKQEPEPTKKKTKKEQQAEERAKKREERQKAQEEKAKKLEEEKARKKEERENKKREAEEKRKKEAEEKEQRRKEREEKARQKKEEAEKQRQEKEEQQKQQAEETKKRRAEKAKELLNDEGKFKDPDLELKYEEYLKRKQKANEAPRDRVEWKEVRDYWLEDSPVARGNRFNKQAVDGEWYPYDEVHLENGKRVDSYDPFKGEIVSRKATNFDVIDEGMFNEFLSELKSKYAEGTKIRSDKYPNIDGQPLKGKYVLEVPESNAKSPNFEAFKAKAAAAGVEIRLRPEN
jgi:DNA anti-recombination protein RmuC